MYLKTDVVLLAYRFPTFRKTCMDAYKLDPLHYYTAPGLSLDALPKQTKIDLELHADIDMHLFIEKGDISMVFKRQPKAYNPHTADYNPEKENNFIMYNDANNLYGGAMNRSFPYSGFKWLTKNDQNNGKFKKETGKC